jgi:tripartite-type tricarboxylate transporter receptor subunit TctC
MGEIRRKTVMLAVLLGIASALAPLHAVADYPDKPVRLIVAYPAGGATDVIARAVAARLRDRLKQAVVVENRPGASGMIGTEAVAKAAPDGYTLVFAASDTHSINPHVYPTIRYDARRDFVPVALVGWLPFGLIVSPSLQATSVAQFIAQAKQNPGKVTFASWGVGSSGHVAMEMLRGESSVNLLHVPFQGAAPALTAVMGGQVDAMLVPMVLAESNHRSGKVRLLGVASPRRFAGVPDVPTFSEQGTPLLIRTFLGIMAPAKVAPETVARLNREANTVLEDPQLRELLIKNGVEAATATPQEFQSLLDSEYARWGKTVREGHITAE